MRDLETLSLEFLFSDLGIIERRVQRLKAEIGKTRASSAPRRSANWRCWSGWDRCWKGAPPCAQVD